MGHACGARISHQFYSKSPWHVSTANQTKSSSVQLSATKHSHAKYDNVCWSKLIGLTFFFFLGNKITQSSESLTPPLILPPHLLAHHPFIFCTSALLSSHSYSPLLLLSYWSVASSIKHNLSIAWLLASKNIGTSLN